MIEQKIKGYSSHKKYCSQKYTPENRNNPAPYFRTTLFWEPEVITKNGEANLTFFTSDETGTYKIFVEGITNKGKICLGRAEFEVY